LGGILVVLRIRQSKKALEEGEPQA
jgi:hypothetical protein